MLNILSNPTFRTIATGAAVGAVCFAYDYFRAKPKAVNAETALFNYYKTIARVSHAKITQAEIAEFMVGARVALKQTEAEVAKYWWFSVPADLKQQLIANRAIVAYFEERM